MDRQKAIKWLNRFWWVFVPVFCFALIYPALLLLYEAHKHSPPETLYCQPIFLPDDDRHFVVCAPAHPAGVWNFVVKERKEERGEE